MLAELAQQGRSVNASDVVMIEPLKASLFVERKVNDGDYGATTVGIHFPVELPLSSGDSAADVLAVDAAIKEGFWIAKAHVFEQIGRKFEDKDGVLLEVIEKVFPNSQEVAAPRGGGNGGNRPPVAPAAGMPDECEGCGGTDFYDNRPQKAEGKYSAKYPDFKCKNKDCAKAVWLSKKGGR